MQSDGQLQTLCFGEPERKLVNLPRSLRKKRHIPAGNLRSDDSRHVVLCKSNGVISFDHVEAPRSGKVKSRIHCLHPLSVAGNSELDPRRHTSLDFGVAGASVWLMAYSAYCTMRGQANSCKAHDKY